MPIHTFTFTLDNPSQDDFIFISKIPSFSWVKSAMVVYYVIDDTPFVMGYIVVRNWKSEKILHGIFGDRYGIVIPPFTTDEMITWFTTDPKFMLMLAYNIGTIDDFSYISLDGTFSQ